jgi:hypothetical protein
MIFPTREVISIPDRYGNNLDSHGASLLAMTGKKIAVFA